MSISGREKKLLLIEQDVECDTIYFERKKRKKVVCVYTNVKREGNQIYVYI